jgi:hypothetical protein
VAEDAIPGAANMGKYIEHEVTGGSFEVTTDGMIYTEGDNEYTFPFGCAC